MAMRICASALCALLVSCGGGGGGGGDSGGGNPTPPATIPSDIAIRISANSPFAANCAETGGTLYPNAEVEPHIAVNPANTNNLIAAWQQDRWSNGSSQGLASAYSFDGGVTWTNTTVPFSNCSGGNAANGGDYLRATDPWVTFSPDGVAYQMALSTSGAKNAMLVSRSADNGRTWSNPTTLILDGADAFNDKNAITADSRNNNFVYAVWDRLAATGGGATYFARTVNGGQSWEAARNIYDPGVSSQTIGNIVVSLPSGAILNFFTQIDTINNRASSTLNVIRSIDNGTTWGPRVRIADVLAIGARDPETGTAVRDSGNIGSVAVAPNGDVHAVWQDSRFSSGVRDEIALSTSRDGGLTWSTPARVSGATGVASFVPTVAVSADGTIGVTYYDFRSNTADATTLLTDYWLARSRDGVNWTETRVSPAFDLANAPVSNGRGYFLGDYQGLVASGNTFVPLFVRTNNGNVANRTDVFAARVEAKSALSDGKSATAIAREFVPDEVTRNRVSDNIVAYMENRQPRWRKRVAGRNQELKPQ